MVLVFENDRKGKAIKCSIIDEDKWWPVFNSGIRWLEKDSEQKQYYFMILRNRYIEQNWVYVGTWFRMISPPIGDEYWWWIKQSIEV